jgi:hypothetical protein
MPNLKLKRNGGGESMSLRLITSTQDIKTRWKKYRKMPVVIEATKLTERIKINTKEGVMIGEIGDFLIQGIAGELYPCKNDIFHKTYEEV